MDQIKRGLRWGIESPNIFIREANRIYYSQRYGPGYNRAGADVIEEDWDTLIILDACRYDMFKDQNTLSGQLETRTSRSSHTSEFLRGNFKDRTIRDTVYTTASPQLERYRDEIDVEFHTVKNVWNTDRWDDEEGTVRPEDMTAAGLEAHERYPNKRHIVHYMQPHYPFIGSSVDEGTRGFGEDTSEFDIWEQRIRGRIDMEADDVWPPYRHNLDLALDSVSDLCAQIDGKIVVTSDHGNMLGERCSPFPIREWGHPAGVYDDHLVTVPWFVVESEGRRRITSGSRPTESDEVDTDTVNERLKDLGYV
ncbi:alkaline phosphatase family protein [Halalkalicoccus ordinarius]|uniref:hypothetical protein n=1 Tax=Halalkalicoccus ordinarius TaxID=3116651 RepID=UPI00300F2730